MVQFNQHIEHQGLPTEEHGSGQIDFIKLRLILKKSIPWFIGIFILMLTTAVLYLRYTKPMYESSSEIKLDKEDQSNVLGLAQYDQTSNIGLLSSEMELIQSRLFFNKVVDAVKLNPQYFTYGKILVDEKYLNPPFRAEYNILNAGMYNINIDVTVLNTKQYELSYTLNNKLFSYEGKFNQTLNTPHIICTLTYNTSYALTDENEFYFKINSREALINYIEQNLSVEPLNLQANTFKISFTDHNLNKAHALVNAIDTLYLNYSLQEKNKANHNKITYLNKQLAETAKKLDSYETYFEDFTIDNKTVDLNQDVKRTVETINGLDSLRENITKKLAELEQLQTKLEHPPYQNLTPKTDVYPRHLIESMEEFNLMNNDLQKLGLSYKENTYTYKSRQKEVELLRADILSEINDVKHDLLNEQQDLAATKLRLKRQLISLPSKNTEYNKTKRFYSVYEEVYLSLMQSKNEFEIAVAGSITKIKILSPASLNNVPIYPVPLFAYGTAFMLSIVFSFIFGGATYLTHNKIQSLREIEHLTSATTLGAVPKHNLNGKVARIVVDKHPKSAISEALRSIRTNIEFMVPDKPTKVLSITSTIGSEGKTFICTNLGALLAMAGKKTVIVDLDLRKPKVHVAFRQPKNELGVSSILIGKATIKTCVQQSDIPNLEYITAGPVPPNPSELILRKEFNQLIEDLKKTYEVIILDTPPVGLVTDGLLAMQKADLPLYILKADFSKRSFIDNINRVLATGQFNNLSVILNATSNTASGYGYGYGKKSAYYEG